MYVYILFSGVYYVCCVMWSSYCTVLVVLYVPGCDCDLIVCVCLLMCCGLTYVRYCVFMLWYVCLLLVWCGVVSCSLIHCVLHVV